MDLTKQVFVLLCLLSNMYDAISSHADCIHDQIQPRRIMTTKVKYTGFTEGTKSSRKKRSHGDLYKPMRIYVHYSNLSYQLNSEEEKRLKRIIKETTTKISNILSVIPVKDKLLLRRSDRACGGVLAMGINKDKCSHVGKVNHETCLDNFRIPQQHLEGLFLYNYSHPDPVRVVWREGEGVKNTDYIIYVRSVTTNKCLSVGRNVIAYAAYCQVDENYRPIAGYINFCPQLLRTQENEKKISVIALHEFFHALGFTSELFDKFRDCSNITVKDGTLSCPTWHKPTRVVVGTTRLVTPNLVKLTSDHYGCSTHSDFNEFGPRLQTENGYVGSHWDAAFLQGSLMAPNIGLPELTVLDPITLAAFADMGWYKVNFDFAEDYVWGKDEGCSFSKGPGCQQNTDFYCKKRSDVNPATLSGCHYLHQHKGLCGSNDFLHSCTVFKATSEGSCRETDNQKHAIDFDEKFQPDSRCFVANLTTEETLMGLSARCYQHRCLSGTLEVLIGSAGWITCPYGQKILVNGYKGLIECPREGILCIPARPVPVVTEIPVLTTTTTALPTLPHYDPDAKTYDINITFPDVNYIWLESQNTLPLFKERVKNMLAHHLAISQQRMTQVKIHRYPTVTVGFSLLPSNYPGDGPISEEVFAHLERVVAARNLTVTVREGGAVYTATSVRQSVGGPTYSSAALPAGVVAGMVIGSLLAVLIFGALVFFVQRYYAVHSRVQPNRNQNHDARALAAQQHHRASLPDAESTQADWTHERAVSVLSTSDINMDDGHSFSDFSDSP